MTGGALARAVVNRETLQRARPISLQQAAPCLVVCSGRRAWGDTVVLSEAVAFSPQLCGQLRRGKGGGRGRKASRIKESGEANWSREDTEDEEWMGQNPQMHTDPR